MNCRHCSTLLQDTFADLASAPLSNRMLTAEGLQHPERWYPLKVMVCPACFLVQTLPMEVDMEIFDEDYTYFSSFSSSWLAHARRYVDMISDRLKLGPDSFVVEIASNDGYLLRGFVERQIPCLGVEPTANTAKAAKQYGVESIVEFFGETMARKHFSEGPRGCADLILGNNVLAHVPDINDFVAGLKQTLKPEGTITLEFPHLLRMVEQRQFDTIYHEHFSYLSAGTVNRIFKLHGLVIYDVEELSTHGGSLRIFACHVGVSEPSERINRLLELEDAMGMNSIEYYTSFQAHIYKIRTEFLRFLLHARKEGLRVAGYGAAAKGNTLLNYAGVRGNELIEYVADASPHKQGRFLPGSRIPVCSPQDLIDRQPDVVVVFPWNLWDEVREQLAEVRDWGGRFVRFIPETVVS